MKQAPVLKDEQVKKTAQDDSHHSSLSTKSSRYHSSATMLDSERVR